MWFLVELNFLTYLSRKNIQKAVNSLYFTALFNKNSFTYNFQSGLEIQRLQDQFYILKVFLPCNPINNIMYSIRLPFSRFFQGTSSLHITLTRDIWRKVILKPSFQRRRGGKVSAFKCFFNIFCRIMHKAIEQISWFFFLRKKN